MILFLSAIPPILIRITQPDYRHKALRIIYKKYSDSIFFLFCARFPCPGFPDPQQQIAVLKCYFFVSFAFFPYFLHDIFSIFPHLSPEGWFCSFIIIPGGFIGAFVKYHIQVNFFKNLFPNAVLTFLRKIPSTPCNM